MFEKQRRTKAYRIGTGCCKVGVSSEQFDLCVIKPICICCRTSKYLLQEMCLYLFIFNFACIPSSVAWYVSKYVFHLFDQTMGQIEFALAFGKSIKRVVLRTREYLKYFLAMALCFVNRFIEVDGKVINW